MLTHTETVLNEGPERQSMKLPSCLRPSVPNPPQSPGRRRRRGTKEGPTCPSCPSSSSCRSPSRDPFRFFSLRLRRRRRRRRRLVLVVESSSLSSSSAAPPKLKNERLAAAAHVLIIIVIIIRIIVAARNLAELVIVLIIVRSSSSPNRRRTPLEDLVARDVHLRAASGNTEFDGLVARADQQIDLRVVRDARSQDAERELRACALYRQPNSDGTRTRNPQIRSLIRYPLRHGV